MGGERTRIVQDVDSGKITTHVSKAGLFLRYEGAWSRTPGWRFDQHNQIEVNIMDLSGAHMKCHVMESVEDRRQRQRTGSAMSNN